MCVWGGEWESTCTCMCVCMCIQNWITSSYMCTCKHAHAHTPVFSPKGSEPFAVWPCGRASLGLRLQNHFTISYVPWSIALEQPLDQARLHEASEQYHLTILSISLRFEHAYSMPSLVERTSCGWSFTEIARPGIRWSPEAAGTLRECHICRTQFP